MYLICFLHIDYFVPMLTNRWCWIHLPLCKKSKYLNDDVEGLCFVLSPTLQVQRILLTVATFPYSAGSKDLTDSCHLSLQCRVKGSYWQSPPFPTMQGQRILLTVATFPYNAGSKDLTDSRHLSLQCRVKGSYWQSPPFPTMQGQRILLRVATFANNAGPKDLNTESRHLSLQGQCFTDNVRISSLPMA